MFLVEQEIPPVFISVGAAGAVYAYLKEQGLPQSLENAKETLRTISGLEAITGGKIVFKGNDLTGKVARDTRVKMGIAHVPEGRRVFPSLTVRQNLELGAILRRGRQGIERDMEYVFQKFPRKRK